MKFYIWVFSENLPRKFNYDLTTTTTTTTQQQQQQQQQTLYMNLLTFMEISRRILLRSRNVSDKSCTANQNTHFMWNNFLRRSYPLGHNVEEYGIGYIQTGHRWKYNKAYGVLDKYSNEYTQNMLHSLLFQATTVTRKTVNDTFMPTLPISLWLLHTSRRWRHYSP